MHRVQVYPHEDALAWAAAEQVAQAAVTAIEDHGDFLWCLSGGQTPRPAYERLATDDFARRIDWARTEVFFGDERCVPPDDPASNYRMAREALLGRVPLPEAHVHRIHGELAPEEAADAYEALLRDRLGVDATGGPRQGLDLVLLGLGGDGHTASLFPGSDDASGTWASARRSPSGDMWRVTLTPRVLDAARQVCFLVSGPAKAGRLAEVLTGVQRPRALPAQRIRPVGDLVWLVDRAAAEALLSRDVAASDPPVRLEVHR